MPSQEYDDRPYVLMNMAMSADGKISTFQKKSVQFSSVEDRRVMDEIRFLSDAIIIGANSLRIDGIHLWIKSAELTKQRLDNGKSPHPINIVLSRSLNIPLECRFFTFPETEKWLITSNTHHSSEISKFKTCCQIIQFSEADGQISLKEVMLFLKKKKINTLLLEGGSSLNYQMLAHNYVDEIYLTICPLIIGGKDVATPVGGFGFSVDEFRNLRLMDFRQQDGELFLHYKVIHQLQGNPRNYVNAIGREDLFKNSQ